MNRYLFRGFVLWLVGTVVLRVVPAGWIPPDRTGSAVIVVVAFYVASFVLMFFALGRPIVRALPPADARLALLALILPTLTLDAFSAAFFASAFPNLPGTAAGVFGGWMLVCCAGCAAAAFLAPKPERSAPK
jgi:hypothetical protein